MRYNIENNPQFQKDTESKAILNVDKNALSAYRAQRKTIKKALNINVEMENLKQEMLEIKSLLVQLINNK